MAIVARGLGGGQTSLVAYGYAGGTPLGQKVVQVLSEVVEITEGLLRRTGLQRLVAESVTVTEALLRRLALARIVSEAVDGVEGLSRLLGRQKAVQEVVTIPEGTLRAGAWVRALLEAVEIPEALAKARGFARRVSETVEISELSLIAGEVAKALLAIVTEVVAVTEDLRVLLTDTWAQWVSVAPALSLEPSVLAHLLVEEVGVTEAVALSLYVTTGLEDADVLVGPLVRGDADAASPLETRGREAETLPDVGGSPKID